MVHDGGIPRQTRVRRGVDKALPGHARAFIPAPAADGPPDPDPHQSQHHHGHLRALCVPRRRAARVCESAEQGVSLRHVP